VLQEFTAMIYESNWHVDFLQFWHAHAFVPMVALKITVIRPKQLVTEWHDKVTLTLVTFCWQWEIPIISTFTEVRTPNPRLSRT